MYNGRIYDASFHELLYSSLLLDYCWLRIFSREASLETRSLLCRSLSLNLKRLFS